jgi:hypothetical protein
VEDICCTLGADEREDRVEAWREVLAGAVDRTAIPGGLRVSFGADAPLAALARLAGAEHECCRFFSFALTIDGRGAALEVTAPEDAAPLVDSLFG